MYLVESKGGAIACMLIALVFLGTWPAVLTMLERRGRLPQHTYLDYSITNLLVAVLIAFTFGQIGSSTHEMPNFLTQLSQVSLNFESYLGISFLSQVCCWYFISRLCIMACNFLSDIVSVSTYFNWYVSFL